MTMLSGAHDTRQTKPPAAPLPWRCREFLPLTTVAELLGVSRASVYKLNVEGRLPFKRVAGRVVVPVADVAAFVDAGGDAWSAGIRGAAARRARSERARARREGAGDV